MVPNNLRQRAMALLLFNDESCRLVRQALPLEVWAGDPGVYALASGVYDYIDNYHNAPKSHAIDVVMGLNVGDDTKPGLLNLLNICNKAAVDINQTYILDCINNFQQQHNMKQAIMGGMERLDKGDIEGAEQFVLDKIRKRSTLFKPGKKMADGIDFLYDQATNAAINDRFPLGIPDLDKRGLCPTRRELWVIQGPKKGGKSWALIQAGKQALIAGKKVLHISLELRWEFVIRRYFQTFFNYKNLDDGVTRDLMVPSGTTFDTRRATNSGFLSDVSVVNGLKDRLEEMPVLRDNLVIEEFPSNTLTVPALRAFLDALQIQENFVPDLIIIDYGAIMHIPDPKAKRLYIGAIYLDLRAIAQERNVAVATAIQTNREGSKEEWADSTDVAEDFSVAATVDTLITYNQSDGEAALGLARLWVSDARNGQDKFGVLISQNYSTGQFCLTSQLMDNNWTKLLKDTLKKRQEDCGGGGDKPQNVKEKTLF